MVAFVSDQLSKPAVTIDCRGPAPSSGSLDSMIAGNHWLMLIGNLISARSFTGKVTQKAGPRAAMAALGPAFRRVLELVTEDEVHRQSSVARITQDQRETCQQMTPSAVFCAERSPDETTMVFRSWLGTCPCQCRSVHSARCPNDAPPPHRPGEQWPVAFWVPTSARDRNVAKSSRPRRLAAVR